MWSQQKIVQRIYGSIDRYGEINPQQYRQIKFVLQRTNSEDVFQILYSILTDQSRPNTRFADQEFAGRLLLSLNPNCTMDPLEAIRELVKWYDLSVEEIPWYFAQRYGVKAVREILAKLRSETQDDEERRNIDTWDWWLTGSREQLFDGKEY